MKVEDIWDEIPRPSVFQQDADHDVRRKGWYEQLNIIEKQLENFYEKLGKEGKIAPYQIVINMPKKQKERDFISLPILARDQRTRFIKNDDEGKKVYKWVVKMQDKQLRLNELLVKDLRDRGPPYKWKGRDKEV